VHDAAEMDVASGNRELISLNARSEAVQISCSIDREWLLQVCENKGEGSK
jgi:hypothetical protein